MCRDRTQPNRLKTKAAHCLACLLTLTLCAAAAEEHYSGGTGEPDNPFRISKVADWQELMETDTHWDKHFRLIADLDLEGIPLTPVGTSADNFIGIFDGKNHVIRNADMNMPDTDYVGLFSYLGTDGQIKDLGLITISIVGGSYVGGLVAKQLEATISGCYWTGSVSGDYYVGGLVGRNRYGTIINCDSAGSVSCTWGDNVGGLVGYSYEGIIDNCRSTGSVSGNRSYVGGLMGGCYGRNTTNCYTTGSVSGEAYVGGLIGRQSHATATNCYSKASVSAEDYVGGLVGWNTYSVLSNCCSTGIVSGTRCHIGGLVGYNGDEATVIRCYSTGSVNAGCYGGGLVGFNEAASNISDCYSTGSVSGDIAIGGVVGYNSGGTVIYCYSSGFVSGGDDVGGFVGRNTGSIAGCYSLHPDDGGGPDNGYGSLLAEIQMRQQGNFVGWDFVGETVFGTEDIWAIDEGQGYPKLAWEDPACPPGHYSGGSGTQADPFKIGTVCDWEYLMDTPTDWKRNFVLIADLDLEGISLIPIGNQPDNFTGVFDGNNHIIRKVDLNMPDSDLVGLFGYMRTPGQIKNLGVEDITIVGKEVVGGLVGFSNRGTISNCHCAGSVDGVSDVGGLVGDNFAGLISECYSIGSVNGVIFIGGLAGLTIQGNIDNCYSTASSNGEATVGGLLGQNQDGSISNCYSDGSVSSTYAWAGGLVGYNYDGTISDCRSTASVSGEYYVGGLVGSIAAGTVTYSYSAGTVKGLASVGGLVGYNFGGAVSNCYSTGAVDDGNVVGGLVGYNKADGSINDCYSSGEASGIDNVGGLVGRNAGEISRCYAAGSVIADANAGGLVGYNIYSGITTASFWDMDSSGLDTSAGGVGMMAPQMQTPIAFTDAGWDFVGIWTIDEGHDYPRLLWEAPFCPAGHYRGSGTVDDPFIICSAETLNAIGANPDDWDSHFALTGDIDLSGYAGSEFNPIGNYSWEGRRPFTGVFDGRNHVISNLTYETVGPYATGLFAYASGQGSRIMNVGLRDVTMICSEGTAVGSLVGYLEYGAVTDCWIERGTMVGNMDVGGLIGDVWDGRVQGCYSENVFVSGTYVVGGLLGGNVYGEIKGCHSISSVEGEETWVGGLLGNNNGGEVEGCYSVASVRGQSKVGGLAGDSGSASSSGRLTNSWSSGHVEGGQQTGGLVGDNGDDISYCFSSADVSGTGEVGGLVGRYGGGNAWNCYATGNVAGDSDVGGLLGLHWFNESYPGTVSKCFSTGIVTGDYWSSGGLVGYSIDGIVEDSFWDADSSEMSWSEGGVGKTTEQMQTKTTFTDAGWDFVDVWAMCEGTNYPRFVWQVPLGDVVCPDGVNGLDFAVLAEYWRETNCAALDDCEGADTDLSGGIDFDDVAAVAESWLSGL